MVAKGQGSKYFLDAARACSGATGSSATSTAGFWPCAETCRRTAHTPNKALLDRMVDIGGGRSDGRREEVRLVPTWAATQEHHHRRRPRTNQL